MEYCAAYQCNGAVRVSAPCSGTVFNARSFAARAAGTKNGAIERTAKKVRKECSCTC